MHHSNQFHHDHEAHFCSICGEPLHHHYHSPHHQVETAGLSTSVLLFAALAIIGLLIFRTNTFEPPRTAPNNVLQGSSDVQNPN